MAVLPAPTTATVRPTGTVSQRRVLARLKLFDRDVAADLGVDPELHAEPPDLFRLFGRDALRHLVLGHAVRVQPARQRLALVDGHVVAEPREIRRAREPRGAGADDADRFAVRRARLQDFAPRAERV